MLVTQLCLTVTPWTRAHEAPLSMEFPRQEGPLSCASEVLTYHKHALQLTFVTLDQAFSTDRVRCIVLNILSHN